MGWFSKDNKDSYTTKSSIASYEVETSSEKTEFADKLFDVLSSVPLKLECILDTFDIDDYDELLDHISAVDDAINNGTFSICNVVISDMVDMLKVFGYDIEVVGKHVRFNTLGNRERIQNLLDTSYNEMIMDIKFIAYIEGKTELCDSIPYDACMENYSLPELIAMCNKLDTVKFHNFEIEMR